MLLLPGQVFNLDQKPSNYVRAAYSLATEEQIEEGIKRFAELLKQEIESSQS